MRSVVVPFVQDAEVAVEDVVADRDVVVPEPDDTFVGVVNRRASLDRESAQSYVRHPARNLDRDVRVRKRHRRDVDRRLERGIRSRAGLRRIDPVLGAVEADGFAYRQTLRVIPRRDIHVSPRRHRIDAHLNTRERIHTERPVIGLTRELDRIARAVSRPGVVDVRLGRGTGEVVVARSSRSRRRRRRNRR